MALQLIITNAGRAAIVAQGGTNAVQITQIGISESNGSFSPATTALPNELKRISGISGEAIEDDLIHLSFIDQSTDAYAARALAVYLSDGTLFAIVGSADPITQKIAATDAMVSFDIKLVDIVAGQISFGNTNISNPPATTAKPGVIEIATSPEVLAAQSGSLAITPATLKAYIDARIAEGINAARLGGQLPAFYTDIVSRLGFTPADAASLANVWRSTNDGSGSGLDADYLDGKDASEFALMESFTTTQAANGSQSLPNGLILKWARGATDSPADVSSQFVGFNAPFPNACLFAITGIEIAGSTGASNVWYQNIGAPTQTGVSVERQVVGASGGYDTVATAPLVFAIGY